MSTDYDRVISGFDKLQEVCIIITISRKESSSNQYSAVARGCCSA